MTATAKPVKIILQGPDDLIGQACVAKQALADGRPANGHRHRVYCADGDWRQQYGVTYNKASITVWPQPSADATAKRRETA
jgi:hypothetical protein